jgi:uncharacterized protein
MKAEKGHLSRPMKVWILSGGRLGDLKLMESVALALGETYEVKVVKFRAGWKTASVFLPEYFLENPDANPFKGTLPDLVLVAEATTSALAARAKATRNDFCLVSLARPRRQLGRFDLIISPPQYPLPDRPNIRRIPAAPHILPPLDEAGSRLGKAIAVEKMQRPLTGVLVGGTSIPDCLDETAARMMCEDIAARIAVTGGTALILTSPRTGQGVVDVIAGNLPSAARLQRWQPGRPSDFLGVLALCDEFIVTSDSVSMVIEAMLTGKPVMIYPLPTRPTKADWIERKMEDLKIFAWLFNSGIMLRFATRPQMFAGLMAQYDLQPFSPTATATGRPALESSAPFAAQLIRDYLQCHKVAS